MAQLTLPHIDTEVVLDRIRDVDLSRLGDEVGRLQVADHLRRLDLPDGLRDRVDIQDLRDEVRQGIRRLDRDLPQVRRILGRPEPQRIAVGPGLVFGVCVLVSGVVAGGILAWLFHPSAGAARRKALRRRLHRLQRRAQHAR